MWGEKIDACIQVGAREKKKTPMYVQQNAERGRLPIQ